MTVADSETDLVFSFPFLLGKREDYNSNIPGSGRVLGNLSEQSVPVLLKAMLTGLASPQAWPRYDIVNRGTFGGYRK